MPNFIRVELIEKEETTTSVQDLSTIARQQLILRELCPVDDLTSINPVEPESNPQTDRLTAVMVECSKQKVELDSKVDELTKQINEQNKVFRNFSQNKGKDSWNQNQQSSSNSNYRGSKRENFGGGCGSYNRGGYQNLNNYQNNQGNYQNQNQTYYPQNKQGNVQQGNNQNQQQSPQTVENQQSGHVKVTPHANKQCKTGGYPNRTAKFCLQSQKHRKKHKILSQVQPKN